MYIDLIVLIILIALVIWFFRRFDSFVYFMAIIDIFLRILSFIKNNMNLPDVKSLLDKYFPDSVFDIIDEYTTNSVNILLKWGFVIIMVIFLVYITKYFFSKRK